jgi:hypothetical protein
VIQAAIARVGVAPQGVDDARIIHAASTTAVPRHDVTGTPRIAGADL